MTEEDDFKVWRVTAFVVFACALGAFLIVAVAVISSPARGQSVELIVISPEERQAIIEKFERMGAQIESLEKALVVCKSVNKM